MIEVLVLVGLFGALAWSLLRSDHEFGNVG